MHLSSLLASHFVFFFCFIFPVHAAVFAINEAIDKGHAESTMTALRNPNALLRNTEKTLAQAYQDTLSKAKRKKEDQASGRVS